MINGARKALAKMPFYNQNSLYYHKFNYWVKNFARTNQLSQSDKKVFPDNNSSATSTATALGVSDLCFRF